MNWKLFDEIFASVARPICVMTCGLAIAFSVVWSVIYKTDVFALAVAAAGAVVGGLGYMRTMDKKTAADAGVPPPIKEG